jgi:hypothetical protein
VRLLDPPSGIAGRRRSLELVPGSKTQDRKLKNPSGC